MTEVYIALGSNIGNREAYLVKALRMLKETGTLAAIRLSAVYETEPVGYTAQAAFLNMACRGQTALEPLALLDALLNTENTLERAREIRWGPRTIDLDLLLYGGERITSPRLIVPHPRMFERAFVLRPLQDVYSGSQIEGRLFAEHIADCADCAGVTLYRAACDIDAPV